MQGGLTFIIRVWQDGDELRFRLENAHTRQHWSFTKLTELWQFLQTQFPENLPPSAKFNQE
jgi:hypothetical protein